MPGVPWFSPQVLPGPINRFAFVLTRKGLAGKGICHARRQRGSPNRHWWWLPTRPIQRCLQLHDRAKAVDEPAAPSPSIGKHKHLHLILYQSAESSVIGQYDAVKQGIRDFIGRNAHSREVIGQSIELLGTLSEELRLLRLDPAATSCNRASKHINFIRSPGGTGYTEMP